MLVLYSNDFTTEQFEEEKQELIEITENKNINDEDVWNSLYNGDEISYSDFEAQIKEILNNYNIIVKADAGRWNGRFEAYKLIKNIDDFNNMLSCYDFITITEDKRHVKLKLTNHDATTYGEMKLINEKGEKYLNSRSYPDFSELKNVYNKYSKLIKQLKY